MRAAAILADRAGKLIESIRPHHVCFARNYYQFSENTFFGTLRADFCRPGLLRDILATKPPEAFTAAYEAATTCNAEATP